MKILITGADGFIGKNLTVCLKETSNNDITKYTRNNSLQDLKCFVEKTDFIFHLAGVNRPENDNEFAQDNTDLTLKICEIIRNTKREI